MIPRCSAPPYHRRYDSQTQHETRAGGISATRSSKAALARTSNSTTPAYNEAVRAKEDGSSPKDAPLVPLRPTTAEDDARKYL